MMTLHPWRDLVIFNTWAQLGASRVTITMDASLRGWGSKIMDRAVNSVWSQKMSRLYINVLELQANFLVLKHLLHHRKGRHVLVKSDNLEVVAYINRQGETQSQQLHILGVNPME